VVYAQAETGQGARTCDAARAVSRGPRTANALVVTAIDKADVLLERLPSSALAAVSS